VKKNLRPKVPQFLRIEVKHALRGLSGVAELLYRSVADALPAVTYIHYLSVLYYTHWLSLNLICASLNVRVCIFINYFTKLGQLVVRKIIKIIGTICHILGLKCNKIDFDWGSAPKPAGGAYNARRVDPLAKINGTYCISDAAV